LFDSKRKGFILRILSLGEILWDVFQDEEFLGGAPLNFSVSVQKLGNSVALLSAVGSDDRGRLAIDRMTRLGLQTDFVQTASNKTTGTAIVTTDSAGNATFAIDRPAAFDAVDLDDTLLEKISQLRLNWIYFGTLAQAMEPGEQRLLQLLAVSPAANRFYDINLREGHWNLPLVQRLSGLATIIKMNESEAERLSVLAHGPVPYVIDAFCEFWSSSFGGDIICITLGSRGCAVWQKGALQVFSGFEVQVVDTVGAGDVFAAGFLHGLENGWDMKKTASFANALGAIVASRAGATPAWTIEECLELISSSSITG
jgi:fructokinase